MKQNYTSLLQLKTILSFRCHGAYLPFTHLLVFNFFNAFLVHFGSFIVMSLHDWQRFAENEALNWRYILCSVLAQSPMFVEDQWLVKYGPLKDYDEVTLWVKCSECCTPYHLNCLPNPSEIPPGKYICTFMGCKK